MTLLGPIAIIFILVLLNGVFVAAEFAIIGIRPTRVEQLAEGGNRTAIGLREVLRNPGKTDRYIATAQLGISLASLGLGMYGEPFLARLFEGPLVDWFGLEGDIVHTISFIVGLTVITYLHVVIGEMVPKSLALQNAERTVLVLAAPMALMQTAFSWAITLLNRMGLLVLRLIGVPPPSQGSRLHTPDELELIISESVISGVIEADEQELVENIFDFSERRAGQVMTPRVHIEAVPVTIGEDALLKKVLVSPHSRLPVYEGTLDAIIGVLHLKDLVHQQIERRPFNLRALVRKVPTVPESLYAEELLALLKQLRVHLAIVIDEYGGTAGIVTFEDLIEEVVGEVRDEFDTDEEDPITVVEPGYLSVLGTVVLDDLEQYVDLGEYDHDVESIGGLVLAELNRLPEPGDSVTVNGVRFVVEKMDGLSIERVGVHSPPTPETPADSH